MKRIDYDVLVVGAGLIGAAFALLLSQRSSLKIALIERGDLLSKPSVANQRVVALGRVATDLLNEVGVFGKLDRGAANPYLQMKVWDDNTDAELEFNAHEFEQAELGYMVDSGQCNYLLHAELASSKNVDLYFNFSPNSLVLEDATGTISNEDHSISARLVVAADGGGSWARQQAKILSRRIAFNQAGIVARVASEHSHQNTAWQRFLSTGPLAFLPLEGNQSSIVWSANNDFADELMQMTQAEFELSLKEAFDARLGNIELLSERLAFPLVSQRAEHYYRPNLVLIGDAAHSIHPLAGQGANLGFKDISLLVNLLEQLEPQDVANPAMLRKYQRARKVDNERTDWLMGALHHAYQNENPWWLTLRARGVSVLAESKLLRKILVEQGMGQN